MSIRFGTSGWRSIIAEQFTFANVNKVVSSVCGYLTQQGTTKKLIVIGHDSRFMGEKFSRYAAEICADHGFDVLLCKDPTPTPAISFAIRSNQAAGGINFTASHNPPEYQGIKFSTSDGAPALPEVTKQIEDLIENGGFTDKGGVKGSVEDFDAKPKYLDDVAEKLDLKVFADCRLQFAYDAFWGTGRGYLNELLERYGARVEMIHDWRDVMFDGKSPEPSESHCAELIAAVLKNGLTLGVATDGDADRFGVIDKDGKYISPNVLIAVLADYLAESRKWNKGFARSVATSHLIDRVAKKRGLELFETPVGFKFIGEMINRDEITLGGEESAGLSIRGHYPEKDGILACMLAVEAVIARGASIGEQYAALVSEVGALYSKRIGLKLTDELVSALPEILKREPTEIGGRKIAEINRMDGVKYIFEDGSWMLMRPSGTEPMVRVYAESENEKDLEVLIEQGRKFIFE